MTLDTLAGVLIAAALFALAMWALVVANTPPM